MDELTLLRALDKNTAAPTQDALDRAFDALTGRMTTAGQSTALHVPTRRRARATRRRRAGLAIVGVAALVTGLVLTDTIGIAGLRPGASAQAAELLDQAARNTIHATDPVLRAGQLRQISSQNVHFLETGNAANHTVFYSIRERSKLWIPRNEHGVWTEVRSPTRYTGQSYGTGAKQIAERDDAAASKQHPQVLHAEAGNFWGGTQQWTPSTAAALPRDPRVLLNHIYRVTIGTGSSPDGEALVFIGDLLRSGLAPADVRSAAYQAAAMIPGVTITAHAATLDGHEGVAVGRVEHANGLRYDLIIDPATGDLIGEREVATRRIDVFPAGTTLDWSSATTTVVDSVPSEYAK